MVSPNGIYTVHDDDTDFNQGGKSAKKEVYTAYKFSN